MRLMFHADAEFLRTSLSFSTSGMVHGAVLALPVFGAEQPRSLDDEAIPLSEERIVAPKPVK